MEYPVRNRTIAVVGGGASGMMAAIAAAGQGAHVTLFERQARVGRKLAATGNGRCNLSNSHADPSHYHGEEAGFCRAVLEQEGAAQSLARFLEMGLLTTEEEDGRVYPMSDHAGSVVDVLRFSLDALGVKVYCGSPVKSLKKTPEGFLLQTEEQQHFAERMIVSCGGKAGGKLGGGADGYRLLESFGHSCTDLYPALVQLRTEGNVTRGLKGVRTQARVFVRHGKRLIAEEQGEVQFTEYGLSGPAIFTVSREAARKPGTTVSLDLFPAMGIDDLFDLLKRRTENRPGLTLDDLFTGTVQNRLGRVLVSSAGLSGAIPLSESAGVLKMLAERAKDFSFRIIGDLGFDQAQVTSGGIRTREFDPKTLESKLCPGLYACGEVLDVDGDCGGYNLQWAWSSGWVAGKSAAGDGKIC